jgi:hypothetical protein
VLRTALLAAAGVPLAGYLAQRAPAPAWAADRLPVTVVNRTGRYANSAVWLYVVGNDGTRQCYLTPDGTLTPVSASLNGADGFADLSIPLAAGGDTTISLPNMSGRIYVSIDAKLRFKVVTDGAGNAALQYPAGWVDGDPGFGVLHDWMEFTFNPAGMFCNTTMVDMFSVPMALRLRGQADQTTGTLVAGGRDAIFAAMKARPDFAGLVVGDDLRVIAPGHGIETGRFSGSYYDGYVAAVWNRYAGSDLVVAANGNTYTGRVSGNTLTFGGGVAPFARPSTRDVLYCNGALAAPNDGVTGPVAAVLAAALNRSTLLTGAGQPVGPAASFYQDATTNHYAQAMHANSVDGKAYGFPFDDVSAFAAYVQDAAPTALTLTLTPFDDAPSGDGDGGSGTGTLLSQGRPTVSSSNETAALMSANAVDGNPGTRWSSAWADPQWISVDLGAEVAVDRVTLSWETAHATAYSIQASDDATTWRDVWSTTSGRGGVDDIRFTSTRARYVRMLGTTRATRYGYSLWDLGVYGT